MNFAASYHQERLWLIDKSATTGSNGSVPIFFNVPLILEINGAVETGLLEESIRWVIQRHEVLRTRFDSVKNQLHQVIDASVSFKLEIKEWTHQPALEAALQESGKPFHLDKGPLIRGTLLVQPEQSLLVITLHHAVVDRDSLDIIRREIFSYYTANLEGTPASISTSLPPLDLHYGDFSQWQRELPDDILESQLLYWRGKWKEGNRADPKGFQGNAHSFTVPTTLVQTIKSQFQAEAVSCRGILMAAFNLLLGRYSGQDEIIVGTGISNRGDEQLQGVVGPIDDLVLTRTRLPQNALFSNVAAELEKAMEQDSGHCLIPLVKMAAELNPHENSNNTSLFNVMFQYQDEPLTPETHGNLEVNLLETNLGWGNYNLNLFIRAGADDFSCHLVYDRARHNNGFISRLVQHYKNLLDSISRAPGSGIFQLSFLTQEELRLLTQENGTDAQYPRDKSIHQLFQEQAARTPGNIAVIFPGTGQSDVTLTYEALNNKANRLAHHLRNRCGIGPNDLAAVLLKPSDNMIVALLGILKAGGAYVPIDPTYPADRVNYILDDSKCRVFITQGELTAMVTSRPDSVMVDIDSIPDNVSNNLENLENIGEPENTAYVIYTSGTTGKPKGCMVSHKNVVRLFKTDTLPFTFHPDDTWIMAHSFCFDFSVWEMYGALLFGGKLVVPPREMVQDVRSFCIAVRYYRVSVLNQTPGAFYNFIEEEKKSGQRKLAEHLRYVCFGGEKLEPVYLEAWSRVYPPDTIRLVNMYGITETTVHVTYYYLESGDIQSPGLYSPIGVPLPETRVYIFDKHMQLVPCGVTGEFYVGGSGVSKGYLYREELTAERFIENPYKKGEILYKTGDLGRWTDQGKLQYVGRIDDQVKIRGYRIELAEIENRILNIGKITRAAVTLRSDGDGDNYLAAYFTSSEKLDVNHLKANLKSFLPPYMIPKYFVRIESFPMTSSGKIDKAALPEPGAHTIPSSSYTPPSTELEKMLTQTWEDVLDVDQIGIHDNFFDLGGDSIKGIRVVNNIQKLLGEIIHIAVLFQAPTIAELAGKLESYWDDHTSASRVEPEQITRLRQIITPLSPLKTDGPRNRPALFILSPPRSGSTLLRVILAGHPGLFAPPELELLSFNTLQERKQGLARTRLAEGAIRAIKEIKKRGPDEAVSVMEQLEDQNLTSFQMYKLLQEWLGDRVLVDKSPFYSLDLEILKRAEQYFDSAKYIHLQRHPGASIHSFVKARIDQVFRYEHPFSLRQLAEIVWTISHQNILQFLGHIPRERQYTVTFEDLVNQPRPLVREMCRFIGIPYDEQMLKVYQNLDNKMTDGLYGESRMVGDVKFLTHTSINPATADNWKTHFQENSLGEPARRLAVSMAYVQDNVGNGDFVPVPVPEADHYQLSPSQRRIWLANHMEKSTVAYNMPFAYRLDGELNRQIIEASFETLVKRHESLRTVFIVVGEMPRQKILSYESCGFKMEYINLGGQQDREAKADLVAMDEAKTPFDLETGPLVRVKLIQLGENQNLLLLNLHHIIADAWSMETIIREMFYLYDAYKKNEENPLPPLKFQFKDYSTWQNHWMNSPNFKQQEKYWLRVFEGEFPVLNLSTDFPRTTTATFEGDTVNIPVDEEETTALNLLAKQENVTLYMIFAAVFNVLLSKISGQEDIVIGSGIEGHKNEEFDRVVGMFFNFLLLRCFPGREKTFIEFLSEVKSMVLGAFQNQDYPIELLVKKIKNRESGRNPLAEVTFAYHNIGLPTDGFSDLSIRPYIKKNEISKFELCLIGVEMNGQIALQIDYKKKLFRKETIEKIGLYFKKIMRDLVDNKHKKLKDFKIDYDFPLPKLSIFERQKSDFVF